MADVNEEDFGDLEALTRMGFEVTEDGATFLVTDASTVYNPFGDAEAVSVDLYHCEIGLTQLADEIAARTGFEVQLILAPIDECSDKLYVSPPVEAVLLDELIAAHEMDDLYSLTPEQRERREMVMKLNGDEPLTPEDIRRALGMALGSE